MDKVVLFQTQLLQNRGKAGCLDIQDKNFIDGVGGEQNARAGLDYLKERAKNAGFGGAHVMTTSDVSKELAEKSA